MQLEKEAHSKGVPIGQAIDIDIPPPRPKRKPRNPYPRKTYSAAHTLQVGTRDIKIQTPVSALHCKQLSDLEKEPFSEVNFLVSLFTDVIVLSLILLLLFSI